jgi:hypothetical protein
MGTVTPGLAMVQGPRFRLLVVMLACSLLSRPSALFAEQVTVRNMEGMSHGLLVSVLAQTAE